MEQIDFNDPLVLAICALGVVLLLVLFLLIFALRASGRAAKAAEPLANQMLMMGEGLKACTKGR